MKDDGIGSSKHTQQDHNTAKKLFAMSIHSSDPNFLKHTVIEKDNSGDDACFFHVFQRRNKPRKKEDLNDSLKLLALCSKKLFPCKKNLHKKYKEDHESTT